MISTVSVKTCKTYDIEKIEECIPDHYFECIKPGDKIAIKPNWVMESHKYHKNEWEQVITNPSIIEAVINKVLIRLKGFGRISIIDGPMTEASFAELSSRYPFKYWKNLVESHGVEIEIIDLRDYEWKMNKDVVVERIKLPGDPRGKVVVNLRGEDSEFFEHKKSSLGYYGADYDSNETNCAHDGLNNIYSVSKTIIESDVFINIPKLKTHRTAGITCCLKNLVGINTYKNYLPHYTLGGPSSDGDQFKTDTLRSCFEGTTVTFVKKYIFQNELLAKILFFLNPFGKLVFGNSKKIIRNGSWYGNDTLWRMVLDLNKILFFANNDGTMRGEGPAPKKYIGIVDAIIAGEGEGPLAPDAVSSGLVISGNCPVAIDTCCALLMNFDPMKIPTIYMAYRVNNYKFTKSALDNVVANLDGKHVLANDIPNKHVHKFLPHNGWKGFIERT